MRKQTIIGLDIDKQYAQITYYNERNLEPETVSKSDSQDRYLIPVPEDLFSLIESSVELGLMTLANFLKTCVAGIRPAVQPEYICMMITMKEMDTPWPEALKDACEMMGMHRNNIFLQTHRESLAYYALNQKRDLWNHKVALFEYDDTDILSYIMNVDYATKPALVKVEKGHVLNLGKQGKMDTNQWNEFRDEKFLEMIQDVFESGTFSSVYLIGDSFDKTWAVESLHHLCFRRHVFQGRNLYTKGACYAAMDRLGVGKKLDNYLYYSEDMVDTNLSMQMEIRGRNREYQIINAGINWFEAEHICEFIPDDTQEIVIYGKSILGEETESFSIVLKNMPERPDRTTRLQMKAKFIAAGKCKVTIRDMGFGEFYPASGLVWESILEV
ncbi:MAG: DUF5716 family protein [Eubacteriales bacterium]|nr:DUF5716 family protein [Eubacteriales bacterium]